MVNAARAWLPSATAPLPPIPSRPRHFLIDRAAIRNRRNPCPHNTYAISNRLYFACFGAAFALHQSLITNHNSPFHASPLANPATSNPNKLALRQISPQIFPCPAHFGLRRLATAYLRGSLLRRVGEKYSTRNAHKSQISSVLAADVRPPTPSAIITRKP
jgi:hypothetical protein